MSLPLHCRDCHPHCLLPAVKILKSRNSYQLYFFFHSHNIQAEQAVGKCTSWGRFKAGTGNENIIRGGKKKKKNLVQEKRKKAKSSSWQQTRPRNGLPAGRTRPLTCGSGSRRGCGRCCRAAPAAAPLRCRPPRCSPVPARRRPAVPAASRARARARARHPPRLSRRRSPPLRPGGEGAGGPRGCASARCARPVRR